MTSVGEILRRERVRQGIDLGALARATHIHARYLQAIERGRVEDLPGAFFYRSFVRQYALALQMNTAELEAELDRVRASGADALDAALSTRIAAKKRRPDFSRLWSALPVRVGYWDPSCCWES